MLNFKSDGKYLTDEMQNFIRIGDYIEDENSNFVFTPIVKFINE
jgi:hypothetical protein